MTQNKPQPTPPPTQTDSERIEEEFSEIYNTFEDFLLDDGFGIGCCDGTLLVYKKIREQIRKESYEQGFRECSEKWVEMIRGSVLYHNVGHNLLELAKQRGLITPPKDK